MTRRDRPTLKKFFADGELPTGDHFADLVDSTVNQVDDGFDKTKEDGLKLAPIEPSTRLMSLYPESLDGGGRWAVGYAANGRDLEIQWVDDAPDATREHPVLTLRPPVEAAREQSSSDGDAPMPPLLAADVHGFVRAPGRLGVAALADRPTVEADGKWKPITPFMGGCNALELIAGFGKKGSGRYALVHAFALNAYNPTGVLGNFLWRKKRIRCQHAYYGTRSDKLQLRWFTNEERARSYRLEIRSRCAIEGVSIQHFVTHLWSDPLMTGSDGTGD